MSNRITYLIAFALLGIMFVLAFSSSLNISATMDELPHISSGYSYVSQKDYRLNPEHPPLVKDLSGLSLIGLDINFPQNHPSWTEGANNQWWFGEEFLYHSGNNPSQIVFRARIPMMILLIILGVLLFFWAKQLGGNLCGLLALTLFSFSPTFLAHGRLVTTDVAAALGVLLGTYFWINFLKKPSKKNIVLAGIALGVSMLLKFSLILLLPFFAIITLIYAWFNPSLKSGISKSSFKISTRFKSVTKYLFLSLIVIAIAAIFIIWPVYKLNILNYPPQKQLSDTQSLLQSNPFPQLKNLCIWMSSKSVFRPWAHYLLGLLMATQRTAAGNTVYFMGMVSALGWWYYFPVVYFLKVPLALHILTLLSLLGAVFLIQKGFWKKLISWSKNWIKTYFTEFCLIIFLAIYWATSMYGNLNIGVRHVLPTFPLMYILISRGITIFSGSLKKTAKKAVVLTVLILLGWYVGSSIMVWPHYLSYFNEVVGGSQNGYKYVVDSNYDWGQDLKRLKGWTTENEIDKIYVDYFGGGDAHYYLGDKYRSWNGTNSPQDVPPGSYLAVSATLLQGGRGNPVPGFTQPTGYYRWLNQYEPIARAGNSIFIYHIE